MKGSERPNHVAFYLTNQEAVSLSSTNSLEGVMTHGDTQEIIGQARIVLGNCNGSWYKLEKIGEEIILTITPQARDRLLKHKMYDSGCGPKPLSLYAKE